MKALAATLMALGLGYLILTACGCANTLVRGRCLDAEGNTTATWTLWQTALGLNREIGNVDLKNGTMNDYAGKADSDVACAVVKGAVDGALP